MIDGSGVCTACGAETESEEQKQCADCAPGAEGSDDSAMPMEGGEDDAA